MSTDSTGSTGFRSLVEQIQQRDRDTGEPTRDRAVRRTRTEGRREADEATTSPRSRSVPPGFLGRRWL